MTPRGVRRLLLLVHQYTGFIFAAYLIVVCVSGAVLLLLENGINGYRDYLMVRVPVRQRTVPLSQIVRSVERANPGLRVRHVLLSCPSGCTYDVSMDFGPNRLDALVDPYTGAIVKTVVWERTAIGVLYSLHGSLFSGDLGEAVNAAAGLSLVVLGCTGLYLWPGWKGIRLGFSVKWPAQPYRLSYDLHKIAGIVSVSFLLMWAVTAAAQVFWADPPEPIARSGTPSNTKALSFDRRVSVGSAALPGEVTFIYPTEPLVVRKRVPGDPDPYGYSYVAVNLAGRVTQVYDVRSFPLSWRVREAMYAVHIGSPGGPVLRVVYAIIGVMPAVLFLTAFSMWLYKLKTA